MLKGWILFKKNNPVEVGWGSPAVDRLLERCNDHGIELKVVSPEEIDLIITKHKKKSVYVKGKILPLPDFVLTRMGSGVPYFAMAIIRHFERLGIPSFNSSFGIEMVRDKLFTQQVLSGSNLPVPDTILVKYPVDIDLVEKHLGFPVIVKTVHGRKGSGVFLSENRKSFEDLMLLLEATRPNVNIILQEFISDSIGRDIRAFVVGDKVIGCMERTGKEGSFKANFSAGGTVRTHEITDEIRRLSLESSKILNLDISGVDLLFDGDGFKICEVNASPGFQGLEMANPDLDVPKFIFNYIKEKLADIKHE